MSILNNSIIAGASANQNQAYNISRSLRFRASGSAYLSRTLGTPTNGSVWTFSTFLKRGSLGTYQNILTSSNGSANQCAIQFNNSDQLRILNYTSSTFRTHYVTSQVFRDPSAWYHIVIQQNSSSSFKVYVNGVQVTSFGTAVGPDATGWLINQSGLAINMGREQLGAVDYFDGYLADTYFVDGQALAPSSFGEPDTVTGVWKPKKYSGSYGTNGFYLPFSNSSVSSYAGSFDGGSQYLTFPNSSNLAFGTGAFTIEGWINSPSGTSDKFILGGRSAIGTMLVTTGGYGSTTVGSLRYVGSSEITSGSTLICNGQWHHFAITRDGSSNVKLFVDGALVGSGTDTTNYTTTSGTWFLGRNDVAANAFLSGSLSNIRINKGTAVYTSAFSAPATNLSAISGTSLLTLQSSTIVDNSGSSVSISNNGSISTTVQYPFVSNIAADYSGNNNSWNANNINLINGTTYDSMTDVPTLTSATASNYATLNPLKNYGYTLADGNLSASAPQTSSAYQTTGTIAVSSGKFYWEVTVGTLTGGVGTPIIGVADTSVATSTNLPGSSLAWMYYGYNGQKYNGSGASYGATWGSNTVIGVALDMDSGTVTFYVNGTSQGTAYSNLSGKLVNPAIQHDGGTNAYSVYSNFGQRPFAYTVPSGFKALNTYNLPTPAIPAGNKVMDVTTYTGTSSARSVTNAGGFKPDLVWGKNQSTYGQVLQDSVRGTSLTLQTHSDSAEVNEGTNGLTAFNSNGFTIGGGSGGWNVNSEAYVAWQWQAGQGSSSSNTSGSTTSTVSVNPSAGFSIVTYAGNSTSGATVGHGLGVAPKMIIIKRRNGSASNWLVYHASVAVNGSSFLVLNWTNAAITASSQFNNTAPSSSVFTVGNDLDTNSSGNNFVAYCWSEVEGFSKFGSFAGNASTDNAFLYLGFRPKFVLMKRTDTADKWIIWDSARNTYNYVANEIYPNSTSAEGVASATYSLDFLSNGIKVRNAGITGTWIYAAFAENPFKNSLAR